MRFHSYDSILASPHIATWQSSMISPPFWTPKSRCAIPTQCRNMPVRFDAILTPSNYIRKCFRNFPNTFPHIRERARRLPGTLPDIPDPVRKLPGGLPDIPNPVRKLPRPLPHIRETSRKPPNTPRHIRKGSRNLPGTLRHIPGRSQVVPFAFPDIVLQSKSDFSPILDLVARFPIDPTASCDIPAH